MVDKNQLANFYVLTKFISLEEKYGENGEYRNSRGNQALKERYDENEESKNSRDNQALRSELLLGLSLALILALLSFYALKLYKKHYTDTSHNSCSGRCRRRLRSSCNSRARTISSSSNISSLLASLDTVPFKANRCYFARQLVDCNGGTLTLDGTGIKLIIPEGAIPDGNTESIYISMIEEKNYLPHLKNGESLLTPVVMCGPHGLRFQKHVLLILPHCVAVQEGCGKFRVLSSDTAPEEDLDWKEIFNTQYDPNPDCFCGMDKSSFSLFVSHFTWHAIPGNCEKKMFSVTAYRSCLHNNPGSSGFFTVRIYCMPGFHESARKVEKEESRLNGEICEALRPMLFYENGGDLLIRVSHLSAGWEILNNAYDKKINYFLMWNCGMNSPNLTFVLTHGDRRPNQINCTFNVVQRELEENFEPTEVIVLHNFTLQQQASSSRTSSSLDCSSSGYATSGENYKVGFIPRELKDSLAWLLDRNIVGRHNYELLTEKLGFEPNFRKWLRDYGNDSPTRRLLTRWESTVRTNRLEAFLYLKEVLTEMQRDDAAEEVDKYCQIFSTAIRETTV